MSITAFRSAATAAALLLLAAPAEAASALALQEAFDTASLTISGSSRVRYETLANQSRPGLSANDDLISIRSHLFAEYGPGPLRVGFDLYDSRAYQGTRDGSVAASDVNAMEFLQLYAKADLGAPAGVKTTLHAGRFYVNLGSRRLAAADDYRNTMTAFTGLRADFAAPNGITGTFMYALPHMRQPEDKTSVLKNRVRWDRETFDLRFWGGVLNRPKSVGNAALEFSYFGLAERDAPGRPTRDRHLQTVGARLIQAAAPGVLDYDFETFYQIGDISTSAAATTARQDVAAWFTHAEVAYTWAHAWAPHLSLEFDYASGDRPGGKFGRFDTLFGMRRSDFPPGGIFSSIGRANILTPALRFEARPNRRFDFLMGYRLMWSASRFDSFSHTGVIDPTGAAGSFAGHAAEVRLRYWIVQDTLQAEFDGIGLIKGRQLRNAPNAPRTGDTRYLSFNLTVFF